jgi:hypothetical protein
VTPFTKTLRMMTRPTVDQAGTLAPRKAAAQSYYVRMQIEYESGSRALDGLRADVEDFWSSLDSGAEDLVAQVEAAGIDPHDLEGVDRSTAITIDTSGGGADPASLLIVVSIFAGKRVLPDLWDKVILPRIRYRGKSSIGPEKNRSGKSD